MLRRKFSHFLNDLKTSVSRIQEYTENYNYEEFKSDQMIMDAVLRNFEIIGESVSNLPDDFKQENSHINWQDIKDFRNVITHKYWTIDPEITWDIIENNLPELEEKLEDLEAPDQSDD